jgi:hypothetical protein
MWILFAIIALIVFGFIAFISTPQGKGFWGEFKVKWILGKSQPPSKYVFNNIKLVDEDKSIQIDHVVVSKKGILVIETKNISGSIYGQENQTYWTQVLAGGHVKNKLYNPIKQNKSHIYHISKLLSEDLKITSAVVFVQGNIEYIDADGVYSIRGLKRLIRTKQNYLTIKQMKGAYDDLLNANDKTVTRKEHIQNIRDMQDDIKFNICPRCGKDLVLRKGKNGEFMGGAIAAGIKSTLSALTENTALLSEIGVEKPKKVIGSNTADCMKSGLIIGAAAMIDGFATRMENELGEEFKTIVATGGLAGEVIPCCERKILIDDNLLLDGLKVIYNKNK